MKILKELYPYLIIVIVVILFRTFIATPVKVDGESMYSTLNHKDILILNKLDKNYNRFDIVIIDMDGTKLVKRIIGLPGENIEYKDNVLYIDGKEVKDIDLSRTNDFSLEELYGITALPDDYYFVMGDNRLHSSDSRDYRIGLIKKSDIKGTAIFRIFPFKTFGKIK